MAESYFLHFRASVVGEPEDVQRETYTMPLPALALLPLKDLQEVCVRRLSSSMSSLAEVMVPEAPLVEAGDYEAHLVSTDIMGSTLRDPLASILQEILDVSAMGGNGDEQTKT